MAKAYISEYSELAKDMKDRVIAAPLEPSLIDSTVSATGTSTSSGAFEARTRFVLIHVDGIVHLKVATTSPVATTTNKRLAADQTIFFGVFAGDSIAFINGT